MTPVEIPDNEMNEFGLPRVCIVTGSTENVTFQKVKFQWFPRWISGLAIIPLLAVILMQVMMRRTEGTLPFSQEAFDAWKRGKLMMALSVVGAIVLFMLGGAAMGNRLAPVGFFLCFLAIALPIGVAITMVKNRGPLCVKIDKGLTHLKIPSAEAAAQIAQHLSAGGSQRKSSAA